MKYDYLGRTGLRVSKLTLGTMNLGWKTPEEEAFKIMDKALELGTPPERWIWSCPRKR